MAYVTKYQIRFSDVKKQAWLIELQWQDYAGAVIDLQPADNPLTVYFGDDTDDKNAPLIGSNVDINITITDPAFDKRQFFIGNESDIRVKITGATLFWTGFVKPDYCRYPYQATPFDFTISATDGIGGLKGKFVDFTDEARDTNLIGIIDILTTRGLYKAQNDLIQTLNVLSSRKRIGMRPFENEYTRVELFYDSEHNFISIYDALTYIATSYGGRIFVSQGQYWFQRVPDLPQNETPTVLTFTTPDLLPQENSFGSTFKALGNNDLNNALLYCNNDAYITIAPPLKQLKTTIDYLFIGSLLNGDWHYWDGTMFENWTAFDSYLTVHQMPNTDDPSIYSAYLEYYSGDPTWMYQRAPILWGYGQVNLKTKIRFWGMSQAKFSFRLYEDFGVTGMVLSYTYDPNSQTWIAHTGGGAGDPSGDFTINQDGQELVKEINFDLPLLEVPSIGISQGAPEAYYLEVRVVTPTISNGDSARPAGITAPGVEVYPLEVSVKYQDRVGETDTATVDTDFTTIKELDKFKLIDSQTNEWKTANYINYPGETTKVDWTSADQNYASTQFETTQLRSIVDTQNYAYEILEGSFLANKLRYSDMVKRVSDGKLFMIMQDEYNVKESVHKLRLFEHRKVTNVGPDVVIKKQYKKGEAFNK